MTKIDQLRIEYNAAKQRADELYSQLETAESNRSIAHAREAFKRLGTNENLNVLDIIRQALQAWSAPSPKRPIGPVDASEFVERLTAVINANGK